MQPDFNITGLAATNPSARFDPPVPSACRLLVSGLRESDEHALEHALRKHGAANAHVRIDTRAPAIHCVWTRRAGWRASCGHFVLRFRPCSPELCRHLPDEGTPGTFGHQPLWIDEPVLASDEALDAAAGEGPVQLSQLLIEALMDCMPTHQWAWVLLPPDPGLNGRHVAVPNSRAASDAQTPIGVAVADAGAGAGATRSAVTRTLFNAAWALMGLFALIVGSGLSL